MITRVSKWGSTSGTCTEAAWSNPRDASRGDGMRRQLAPPSTLTSMEHSVANCSRPSSTVTFKPSHARNRLRAAAHLCVWAGRQRVTVEGYRQHSTSLQRTESISMRSKQLYLGAKSCRIKRGIPSADIGTPHNHDVLKRRTSCWKSFSSRPSASKNFSSSNAPIDSPARADGKHADDAPFLVKPVDDAVRIRTEPHPVRIVVSPHFDGAKRHGIELEIVDRLAGLPDEGWISEPAQIAFRPGFQYDPPLTGGHAVFSRLPRERISAVSISSAGSQRRSCPAPVRKRTAVCFYL